jgi:hypothetical protein
MARTILVHLNIALPDDDRKTTDQVADAVIHAITRGDLFRDFTDAEIVCPLAEEVYDDA